MKKLNVFKKATAMCLAVLLCLPLSALPAAAADDSVIANPSFEDGMKGWTLDASSTAGATYFTSESHKGGKALTCWSMQPYTSHVYQTIQGVKPGWYTLTASTQSSGYQDCAYLYANGTGQSKCMTSIPSTNSQNTDASGWNTVTVRGIRVGEDKRLTVGFYTQAGARQFVNLDDITLTAESSAPRPFLLGGDVSQLNYVEDCGAKFYDKDGNEIDCLQALVENGWNFARIRLYNEPGKGHGDGWYYCSGDYMNEEDILDLARRCKDKGMAIEMSFHYSDYWTNGGRQLIPAAWQKEIEGLDTKAAVTKLERLIYTYTRDYMQRLKDQGTTPEYVSLGNEIQGGMLYPYGKAANDTWPALARFFNAGYKAVKEVAPDSQVVIHLDGCGDASKYTTFFDAMKKHDVKYDIIGASYYPYFSRCSVNQVTAFCNELIDRYDKDLMIMETGYNWNATRPDGWTGQLVDNGNYIGVYNSTPGGQKMFLIDLFSAMKNVKDGRCIGDLYWDPIFVEQPGVGWAFQESDDQPGYNIVSNTTLFDFGHKVLPSLDAYAYNSNGVDTASISGKVVGNDTGAGVPFQSVTVNLGGKKYTVTTDVCGQFFLNVPAISASLTLSAPGMTLVSGAESVSLRPGQVLSKVFTVDGGTVTGSVIDDAGAGVSGAVVTAASDSYTLTVTSGAGGSYIIPDLPAGSYSVSVRAAGYQISGGALAVTAAAGESVQAQPVTAVLTSGTLSGAVTDLAGAPLSGVTVTADDGSGETLQAVTDAAGRYTIAHVTAGADVKVTAQLYAYAPGAASVQIAKGEVRELPPFALAKAVGTLAGTITTSTGMAISGAKVTLSDSSGIYYCAVTDRSGRFALDSVIASTYSLGITKEGYIPRTLSDATVELGKTTDLGAVTMPQLVAVSNPGFEQQGSAYEIPAGWTVNCTSNSVNGKAAVRQDRTAFGGAYEGTHGLSLWLDDRFTADVSQTISGLAPGRYIFTAMTYSGIETVSGSLTMYVKDSSGKVIGEKVIYTSGGYVQSSVEFELTSGAATIGFAADAAGGDWAVIDLVQLGRL